MNWGFHRVETPITPKVRKQAPWVLKDWKGR